MNRAHHRVVLTLLAVTSVMLPLTVRGLPAFAAGSARVLSSPSASNVNTFVPTAAMSQRRSGATATLLSNGDVLVAGGGTAAAELYHSRTGTWSRTGSMSIARTNATATLLPDGDVLVAGGCCKPGNPFVGLSSAELYDPSTGAWSTTGSMQKPRSGHTATLLQNGEVLVAGGACNGTAYGCDGGSFLVNLRSAELYDPATGVWTATGSMRDGREFQTATLLPNGEVLVTGGFNSCDDDFCSDLRTAELYDPVTGKWLSARAMSVAREQQTATLLSDGEVLVAGGLNEGGFSGFPATYKSAEIYDPLFNRWTPTGSMNQARAGQTATLLDSGWVLVAGGGSSTSEIYEPNRGLWVPTGSLSTTRTDQTATLLSDGDVLVAGGSGPDRQPLSTAEVYQTGAGPLVSLSAKAMTFPTQQVGTAGNALSFTVSNFGTAPLDVSGVDTTGANPSDFEASSACQQAVAPGASCSILVRFAPVLQGLQQAIVAVADNAPLDPQGVTVSGYGAGPNVWVPTGSMTTPRGNFSSTVLANGEVLVAGGESLFGNTIGNAELYNSATGTFVPTGSLNTAREFQAAARLPDGSVLVAGGLSVTESGESLLSSAEIYHPASGTWSPTAPLDTASDGLTATLLGNGKVLVTGFFATNQELYDPVHGTWSETGAQPSAGYGLSALLHNGQVLVTAGPNGASALYNPATNTWSQTGSLTTPRNGGTATTLQNGEVLVVGGSSVNGGNTLTSAELYNPTKGTWSPTGSLPVGRQGQSAVLLPNGKVLLAGGCSEVCQNSSSTVGTYLYAQGFWSQAGSLPTSHSAQRASVLGDGDVLLAGGNENDSADATPTAWLYISPLISARPRTAAPGQTVTLTGNGFYAHEVVLVALNGPTFQVVARPKANDRGQFSLKVTVPSVAAGTYQLSAQGQTSFAFATSTFVIS
jgi:N-acetylneuraminic acid mutarotase